MLCPDEPPGIQKATQAPASLNREIIKVRAEVNEIETRKYKESMNQRAGSWKE